MKTKRDELLKQAEALLSAADAEARGLTEDERAQYDGLIEKIEALDEIAKRRGAIAEMRQRGEVPQRPMVREAPDAKVGMGARDMRQYSLVRAIRASLAGDWRGAELEREASEATAKRIRREPHSFFVPQDVLESRDLTVGTPTAGGNLVETVLAQSFIELLRNRMVVRSAGARVLSGLVGDVAIAKQTGGATSYWVAESGSPTESQLSVGQVPLTPHTVGAYTDISRKLLKQASLDIEAMVRGDLATAIALAVDYAALHGSGSSNEPTGIANTSGIGAVVGGTNGAAPTWENIVELETDVGTANADIGALAYVTNAKVRGKLKTTEKASGTAQFVWESGQTPLNGYPALVSGQVRDDLDKGTSTGVCSAIFFGNWRDLVIGMWGALDVLVDPYTGGTSGTVRVVAFQDADIAVRHAGSFAAMLDALTS